MKNSRKYSAHYTEYQRTFHKEWLKNPENRVKWNTYQRARTLKQSMVLEISDYFGGKIRSQIRFDEDLRAYRITCIFKKLTSVSKAIFTKKMAEKGYTVEFDAEVTVVKNMEVPS